MFGTIGATELIIILAILLLIFGPSRLGDLGSSLGKGIKGFKKSLKDDEIDVTPSKEDEKKEVGQSGIKDKHKEASREEA